MKKSKRKILIVTLTLIVALSLLVYWWRASNREKLTRHIEIAMEDYRDGLTRNINIAGISHFQWDRVYVYGPYSYCDDIVESLNAPYFWFRCEISGIEYYEGNVLFVFMRNGVIVGDATLLVSGYEFSQTGYSHELAYFVLDDKGNLVWDEDQ